nr:hypothetical protein [Tanacetum cinerariifolium]
MEPIAQLMREEMEKLRDEIRTAAMEFMRLLGSDTVPWLVYRGGEKLLSVAGGKKLISNNICPEFVWILQGETFSTTMMTLPLGGCDMVLGVQWLSTLGDSHFNFQKLRMVFAYKGKTLIFRGTTKPVAQWINGKQAAKARKQASNLVMCVYPTAMLHMMTANDSTPSHSALSSELYDKIQKGWNEDNQLKAKIKKLQCNFGTSKHYSWSNGQLLRKEKLVVSNDETLRNDLMQHFHNGPTRGHSGMQAKIKRMGSFLYWKKMWNQIKQYIKQCDTCQRFKPELVPYPGLLQPFPIPSRVWSEISMDFIDELPMSMERTVIMRCSLYEHVLERVAFFATSQIAHLYCISPQSDGHAEVINRSLECYPRCMCEEKPKEWVNWIPLTEYWYNTSYHTTIKTTPYQVVYGQVSPDHITYTKRDSAIDVVDRFLSAMKAGIDLLKFHIKRPQDKMKSLADKHKSDKEFEEGVWVYLKLQPYRHATLRQGKQNKLSPKYFGPFLIIKKAEEPPVVLDRRMAKKGNVAVVYVLIQWVNGSIAYATWEMYDSIVERFPHFDLDA